ncbi:FkbM family methyltransferase, partial [Candidatus Methylomirabilis sp.]|uniref:FkbM family methyltransferase n=1 Tax=Candidatus Methylomirabilis sp. TaxID=2032687 RepID=UPI003C73813B
RVDFIKLDVEGAERQALIGSLDTLKRFRPVMIMEFNPAPIKRFYGENRNPSVKRGRFIAFP